MALGDGVARYGIVGALATAGLVAVGANLLRTPAARRRLDTWLLRLPVLGPIAGRLLVARFARTLGTLLMGGVSILEALRICSEATWNATVSRLLERAGRLVGEGETLEAAVRDEPLFPPVATALITVGEETGTLNTLLLKLADICDFEADNALRRVLGLLEPVVILVMGLVVGLVVMAVLLPIFQLNTQL